MKVNWGLIKFILISGLLVFLFSFTNNRNKMRKLSKIEVEFIDENDPFITVNTVNKLLIQNIDSVTSITKETLVLKEMEDRLLKNSMIRDAEVFLSVDGTLGAKIEQRSPIGRIAGSSHYYLDDDGKKMPLSSVYSTRVPLISGVSSTNFNEVTELLQKINEDAFMKGSVVGVHVNSDGTMDMKLRKNDLIIHFGKPIKIENKIRNFKAFYKKTKEDNTFSSYSQVNLQFNNQVVASKK